MTRTILYVAVSFAAAACSPPAVEPLRLDRDFLTQELWNDGRAEVAFYEVERTRNQYGQDTLQTWLAGTYLVKHDFDTERMTKAGAAGDGGVPAFKFALFYEFESRSYEYKRSWVVNARQADLAPIKASFASFDWCANQYREFAFRPGRVDHLYRSDDYGNAEGTLRLERPAVPASLIPLLVRAVVDSTTFDVLTDDLLRIEATARVAGTDSVDVAGVRTAARRIEVGYAASVPSLVGEETGLAETWWIGTGPDRLLLAMRGDGGRYRIRLVETLRSAYWQEDLYGRLERVRERP